MTTVKFNGSFTCCYGVFTPSILVCSFSQYIHNSRHSESVTAVVKDGVFRPKHTSHVFCDFQENISKYNSTVSVSLWHWFSGKSLWKWNKCSRNEIERESVKTNLFKLCQIPMCSSHQDLHTKFLYFQFSHWNLKYCRMKLKKKNINIYYLSKWFKSNLWIVEWW